MSQENVEVVRSVHEITAGMSELDGFTSSS
jgi:hypothetical protein